MDNNVINQLYTFAIFIVAGIIIGIIFDMFRISRKTFKTIDVLTYIEDLIFWIIVGLFLIYLIFNFSNGQIRLYMFIGVAVGVTIYILLFSNFFIKVNVKIITFIKGIIKKILQLITYPIKIVFKVLKRILLKPISFIFINIRKNITNFTRIISNNIKNIKKPSKKHIRKEGFWSIM